MSKVLFITLFFLSFLTTTTVLSCTTTGVTRGATNSGKVLSSQSNDGDYVSDTRLFKVPPMDHPPNSQRPVYPYIGDYPRFVGTTRGDDNYIKKPGMVDTKPMGYIPQVAHTNGFYDGYFGLLNDQGLGIAESTCASRIVGAKSRADGGAGLWYTDELSRIAMERLDNAKEAVQLMGDLAVKGGFYGGDGAMLPGESLIVTDINEVWVFHILPSDKNGSSAIWAAAKVPDGHVAIVPNVFVIREIDFNDSDNFLYSPNIKDIALKNGWWEENTPFDFTKIYSGGEYKHQYYSGRRWWGAAKIFAPSQKFVTEYDDWRNDAPYPFSFKPDHDIKVEDVMKVMRTFYEGTEFSLRNGLASGPHGNGNRFPVTNTSVTGNWERSIALYRTDYSYILELDSNESLTKDTMGTIWFGPGAAHTSEYVPFFGGQTFIPEAYGNGHKGDLPDRTSALWAFRYVQQIVNIQFNGMMTDVKALQSKMHSKAVMNKENALAEYKTNTSLLAVLMNKHAADVLDSWWKLSDLLVYKYADNAIYSDPNESSAGTADAQGYPSDYLQSVGYENGPSPPKGKNSIIVVDEEILGSHY